MRSKANTSPERVGANHQVSLSRRGLLAGISVARGLNHGAAPARGNLTIALCQRWSKIEVERERLELAWGDQEALMGREFAWYAIDMETRASSAGAQKLTEIETRLAVLDQESERLLVRLRALPSDTPEAIVAKLTVAGLFLRPEDCPVVHEMIVRAANDLSVLCGLARCQISES
jgi:hypothetical protein